MRSMTADCKTSVIPTFRKRRTHRLVGIRYGSPESPLCRQENPLLSEHTHGISRVPSCLKKTAESLTTNQVFVDRFAEVNR